jgi:hypothetical protein
LTGKLQLAGREIHHPQAPGGPAKPQYPDLRSVPCSAPNRHAMQSDAMQRHDWRAFPLRWRLTASATGAGASISIAARANGHHFVFASASVIDVPPFVF